MTVTVQQNPSLEMALIHLRAGLDQGLNCIRMRLKALAEDRELPAFLSPETSALPKLATIFRLTDAEVELLMLATAAELDPTTAEAIQQLNNTGLCDIGVAQRLLGAAIWDTLVPEAPLRRWRLIELAGSGPLRQRQVRVDERILHALLGNTYIDSHLEGIIRPTWPEPQASPHEAELSAKIVAAWSNSKQTPVILLGGRDHTAKRKLAANAANALNLMLFRIKAGDIPADWAQRSALAIFLDRELALSNAAILIDAEEASQTTATFAELISGPTLLSALEPALPERQPVLRLTLADANSTDRRALWQEALGDKATMFGKDLDRIATQFALPATAIKAATTELDPHLKPEELAPALWQAARAQGRRALDGLADRIESTATWDDLVLPEDQLAVLHDLAGHMRDAWTVNQSWGWAAKSPRGLGAAALFAGPSGTGKTLAAEVLAGELKLDLYRIDLSQVVSKYIGETEKNLARIFTAAEDGGAVLLFDEADALFGKRSEVKDSHDRYANVEVSYLLQRMEAYSGLAILTTNQKSAVDTAFLRRLRYVLTFPFPDPQSRAEIWTRIFPDGTPREDLSPQSLAKLNIAGGSIRSIALNASYLAASGSGQVQMAHILRATRREYAKLEKPFTKAELEAFR